MLNELPTEPSSSDFQAEGTSGYPEDPLPTFTDTSSKVKAKDP